MRRITRIGRRHIAVTSIRINDITVSVRHGARIICVARTINQPTNRSRTNRRNIGRVRDMSVRNRTASRYMRIMVCSTRANRTRRNRMSAILIRIHLTISRAYIVVA